MSHQNTEKNFLNLIQKHQAIINKICFVYCHNVSSKEDLYQEIVLQLWKSFSSFRSKSSFSTWMYRVALNTAINMTKKPSLFVDSSRIEFSNQIEIENDFSEEIKTLYIAISKLKKIEKAIILLWLEEKPYEEIAEAIGISVKNVSVKLVRIKTKLAEIIKKLQ